jgi:hypothetical protein
MFAAAVLAYISNAPEATPLAIAFAASAGLTISLLTRPRQIPNIVMAVASILMIWGGILALSEAAWAHFEVKLLLMGLTFALQGVLTLALLFGFFGGFPSQEI